MRVYTVPIFRGVPIALCLEHWIANLYPVGWNPTPTRISNRKYPKLKEVDDVLGGSAAWENVDSTEETCPKCSHKRAFFMQIQTRSADEPMTTFYKCCNMQCGHRWRD
ncbi:hypothetical protein LSH36_121g09042 [Paralvinella palmiformis]|uniref:DNA-directed RNA polymerase III subunit RPC10 n=1 Tax=Paralvinella palmiformis TaxID=53620 RepID=A0AAD9JZ31_9ANNE|nr:hypothetical protein LSH36_121g09042 [Paralvinella palmiformis]